MVELANDRNEEPNEAASELSARLGGTEDLLQRAIDKWGNVAQMLMTIEEAAELTQALMHFLRDRTTPTEVAGEVADVIIMAHQMRIVFGRDLVDKKVEEKLKRLRTRLDAA